MAHELNKTWQEDEYVREVGRGRIYIYIYFIKYADILFKSIQFLKAYQ